MVDLTPLLRLYANRRRKRLFAMDPVETQRDQLRRLMRRAARTRFGRDHGFGSIRGVEDFQKAVPLRKHADFWRDYWQPAFPVLENVSWPGRIPYFAVTSGTTADVTKYIPLSKAMRDSNQKAVLDLFTHHLTAKPRSRLFGGKNFMLGGSTDVTRQAPGVYSGDLSGIAAREMSWWARPWAYPDPKLALIADWEEKAESLARGGLEQDIRSIGGTPSWLLILFDKMAEIAGSDGRRLADFWPAMELLIHGGVNFAPYKAQFDALLDGGHAELREVYAASEGFIATADRFYGEGMRLNHDIGLFFEFVPVEELDSATPTRHWIGTAEPGVNYAIVLTTCAGLWAYVLGDTVRLIDRDPGRLLITGRTAYMMSAFGEHLIGEEIEAAVGAAAAARRRSVTDYSVGALFPAGQGDLGGHLYIVEFAGAGPGPADIGAFAGTLDAHLCATNEDYAAHRSGGFGLKTPEIRVVPPGSFAGWMKRRGKLGGQNKVPRIINEAELFADLRAFADAANR